MASKVVTLKHGIKRAAFALFRPLVLLMPARWLVLALARLKPKYLPLHVYIEPTTQCNLKCLHCGRTYWKGRDQHRDLEFDAFERLVKELKALGIPSITIQGLGEPLMHPRIFDMIECASTAGLITRFNSNFTILTPEMAERIVTSGHSEVNVSIESIDPEVYADIRRKGELAPVLANIKLLADTRDRLKSPTPAIQVNAVLMRSNLHEAEEIVRTVKSLGATLLNFQGLNIDGIPESSRLKDGTRMRENALASLPVSELEAASRRIEALNSPEFPITTNWDIAGRYNEQIPKNAIRTCRDLWERPYVDSGGRVTPCCLVPDGMMTHMGNLNEKSFEDIWWGEEYAAFRRGHLTGHPHEVCNGCQAMNFIFDPASGDFVEHGGTARFGRYFISRPSPGN